MRNLDIEQIELRRVLSTLPWLKIRHTAAARGLPASTLGSYLSRKTTDAAYRPLRNAAHADIIWNILHQTMTTINVALVARTVAVVIAVATLSSCATTRPASYEYERPTQAHRVLHAEPYPSRIR